MFDRLHHGDCIAGMKSLPDGCIDLAFADPPYNIGYEYDTYDDRKSSDEYLDWCREWTHEVARVLKPDGAFWLAIGDEYAAEMKVMLTRERKPPLFLRSWVIWYYTFGVNCTNKFSRSHAHLLYFVKDPKRFTFNADDPDVRVPSARQLVYGDKRANPAGRLPDDTWMVPPDLGDGGSGETGDRGRAASRERQLPEDVAAHGERGRGGEGEQQARSRDQRTNPVPLSLGRGVRGEGSDGGRPAICESFPFIPADPAQAANGAAGPPLTPGPSPPGEGGHDPSTLVPQPSTPPHTHNGWFLRPQDVPNGYEATSDTWYFPRVAGTFKERSGWHGCQMPERLLARIIQSCSNKDDIVLDPFAGSGTTLAVAKKLGRQWLGYDMSTDYVAKAESRLTKIKVDDALDGAEDPLKSVPTTAKGRKLKR